MSPEVITRPPWRSILQCSVFKRRLSLIAVDEAHCIPEWFDFLKSNYVGTDPSKLNSDYCLHLGDQISDPRFQSLED